MYRNAFAKELPAARRLQGLLVTNYIIATVIIAAATFSTTALATTLGMATFRVASTAFTPASDPPRHIRRCTPSYCSRSPPRRHRLHLRPHRPRRPAHLGQRRWHFCLAVPLCGKSASVCYGGSPTTSSSPTSPWLLSFAASASSCRHSSLGVAKSTARTGTSRSCPPAQA